MTRPQVKIRKQTNKVTGKTVYIIGDITARYSAHRFLWAARMSAREEYRYRADRASNWGELEDVE